MHNTETYGFTPILGWSITRYEVFRTCLRQYYYQYYGKFDAETDTGRVQRLRALTSIPLQVGSVTHDCIAELLGRLQKRPTEPIDRRRLSDFITNKAGQAASSTEFSETYYGQVRAVDLQSIASPAFDALINLIESERFEWIVRVAASNQEGWIVDPPGYGETRIDGLKAYCKVDFVFPVQSTFHILDWKTGRERPEKHAAQLRAYAAWAIRNLGSAVEKTRPIAAYLLPEYRETAVEFGASDLEGFAGLVRAQTEEMYALCSDVEENVPLSKEAFPLIEPSAVCEYCNFRELCGRSAFS